MSHAAPVLLCLPPRERFAASHPLQRLLLQGNREADDARGQLALLAAHFDAGTAALPAGALLRQWYAGDAGDAVWLAADPAWAQPDMNGVRLMACGQLGLNPEEADALAQAVRPALDEAGLQLATGAPDHWQLRLPPALALPELHTPEQALGEDLYPHLPQGAEGRRWRALFNEIQVLLHQHPLNAQRVARGQMPVNCLWLWGAGRLPSEVRSPLAGVVGNDPLLCALAARAGLARQPRAPERAADVGAGWLIDLADVAAADIERHWWPALAGLARRQPLRLAFAGGERWLHRPWHRWRFWRRPAR